MIRGQEVIDQVSYDFIQILKLLWIRIEQNYKQKIVKGMDGDISLPPFILVYYNPHIYISFRYCEAKLIMEIAKCFKCQQTSTY